jgi:cell wall-associated NlpC family hydrolase
MGLGVQVDNVQAYDWLSKAITALPEGTRRTVAEANRDTVLKRMNASQQAAVAAKAPAPAKPAQEAASKPAATTAAPATTTKTVTEAAATAAKPAATETAAKTTTAKATASNATTANATAPTAKPAATEAPAKTVEKPVEKPADKPVQVASTEPAKADPKAKPTGVRVQLASLPSEAAAWDAWKQISGKYSAQLTGLTAMVESADLGTKGTFYRVQTGPFATVSAAQERCTAMKAAGLDCLVVGKP